MLQYRINSKTGPARTNHLIWHGQGQIMWALAAGGHDTEVLIHVFADTYMVCDRLDLKFAGRIEEHRTEWINSLLSRVEPKEFFGERPVDYPYLVTYKGLLTPEQMREDILFTATEKNIAYRTRIFHW